MWYSASPVSHSNGAKVGLGAHLLSKNDTRGGEDAALGWQAEDAGAFQLVPPVSNASGQSALKNTALTSAGLSQEDAASMDRGQLLSIRCRRSSTRENEERRRFKKFNNVS